MVAPTSALHLSRAALLLGTFIDSAVLLPQRRNQQNQIVSQERTFFKLSAANESSIEQLESKNARSDSL